MFVVITCLFAGILVGFLFRRWKHHYITRVILTFIWLLLFLLGLEVGANEMIIRNFGKLGFEALILSVAGTLGSLIAARFLWNSSQNVRKDKVK